MTSQIPIDPTAHMLYEAMVQLGYEADAPSIVKLVKRYQIGLPAEDEFCVIINWLGNTRLVHKLDQLQTPPESKSHYRIPDLLVIFNHNDRQIAVLIEVKATLRKYLSWKPDYFEGLRRYGEHIGLPVLVAWKHKPAGLWSLFELSHFKQSNKNYAIKLETAWKENIMGTLAGDFMIALEKGVGIHFKLRKEKQFFDDIEVGHQKWAAVIEDVYFTNGRGDRMNKLGPGLWALLYSLDLADETKVDDMYIHQRFIVADDNMGQWAHRVLTMILGSQSTEDNPSMWRDILVNMLFPIEFSKLKEAMNEGFSQGIVSYVLNQVPHTKTDFLEE